jgi:hypothetical protein
MNDADELAMLRRNNARLTLLAKVLGVLLLIACSAVYETYRITFQVMLDASGQAAADMARGLKPTIEKAIQNAADDGYVAGYFAALLGKPLDPARAEKLKQLQDKKLPDQSATQP